jgi:hypothetical protein
VARLHISTAHFALVLHCFGLDRFNPPHVTCRSRTARTTALTATFHLLGITRTIFSFFPCWHCHAEVMRMMYCLTRIHMHISVATRLGNFPAKRLDYFLHCLIGAVRSRQLDRLVAMGHLQRLLWWWHCVGTKIQIQRASGSGEWLTLGNWIFSRRLFLQCQFREYSKEKWSSSQDPIKTIKPFFLWVLWEQTNVLCSRFWAQRETEQDGLHGKWQRLQEALRSNKKILW